MKQSAEFPYTVQTAAGKSVGSRRTEADARGLVRMLEKIIPKDGPVPRRILRNGGCETVNRLLPLLLSALLLAACGPARAPEPATVSIDQSLDPKVILDAAQAWQDATHGKTGLTISVGTDSADIYIHAVTLDGETAGQTDIADSGRVDMRIDLGTVKRAARYSQVDSDAELLDTVEHELGHAFGLEHEPSSLMQADGYWGHGIDAVTLAQFHRING